MSMDLQNCHRFNFGSPVLPSHPSNWELESHTGSNLSFWKRLVNYCVTWWNIHSWFNNFANRQQKIAEKYFGKDIPHIVDVAKNMSLILINQEPLLAYPRPEIPNIIHFSGLHILQTPPSLSKVRHCKNYKWILNFHFLQRQFFFFARSNIDMRIKYFSRKSFLHL